MQARSSIKAEALLAAKRRGIDSKIIFSDKLVWVGRNGQLVLRKSSADQDRLIIYLNALRATNTNVLDIISKYDENEPRDDEGKWTDGGGGDGATDAGGESGASSYSDEEKADLNTFGFTKDAKAYDALRSSKEFGKTLDKLPRVEGTFYRGMALNSQKEADKFAVGKTATIDKHSFATPNKKTAKSYADLQVIKNAKAVPIILTIKDAVAADYTHSGLNEHTSGLKEVVFKMGDKIKIVSRKETVINGADGYLVTAEHVH